MELRRYLSIARHRLPLIVAILIGALVAAWGITPRQARYTASATIYVGPQKVDFSSAGVAANTGAGVPAFDRFISTFVSMIGDRQIAEAAVGKAGVHRSALVVQSETAAAQLVNTNLLVIKVTDPDPTVAKTLAGAVRDAFIDKADGLSAGNDAGAYVKKWQDAELPTVPNANGLTKNMILGLMLGLVIAALVVALLEYLDITIRNADDAERRLGLPVLGVIPSLGERLPSGPVVRVRAAGATNSSGGPRPAPGRRRLPRGANNRG